MKTSAMHSLSMKQCFTNKANSNCTLRDTPEQEHPEEFEMLGAVTYFNRIRISLSIPHFPPPIIFESPLSLSPGRILVEVAADPPEVELEARLRMRAAAPLDGVDVVGKVVAEDGGPL